MKELQRVGVLDPIEEGSSAGVVDNSGSGNDIEELPQEESNSLGARELGEKLCEKTAKYWAIAQRKGELKLYFSPSAGGLKKKKKKRDFWHCYRSFTC